MILCTLYHRYLGFYIKQLLNFTIDVNFILASELLNLKIKRLFYTLLTSSHSGLRYEFQTIRKT